MKLRSVAVLRRPDSPDLRLLDLPLTFAFLQLAGGSLKDAQAQLGHSKLSTTLEIYTVPLPSHQREAVENLSRMVTNGDALPKNAEGLPMLTQQI